MEHKAPNDASSLTIPEWVPDQVGEENEALIISIRRDVDRGEEDGMKMERHLECKALEGRET